MVSQDKRSEIAFSRTNFDEVEEAGNVSDRERRMVHLRVTKMDKLRGNTMLDCGCGTGKDAALLASLGNYVVGTDISQAAIAKAKKTSKNYNVDLDLVVADSEKLPFKEGCFDVCYCFWTLHHFPSIAGVLSELNGRLRAGGHLIIIEPNGSNLVVRLSERIEDQVRTWLVLTGADTPNETMHDLVTYLRNLEAAGFRHIRSIQWFGGGLPPLPNSSALLLVLVQVRKMMMEFEWHLLPPPMNGSDLVLSAEKS